MQWNILEVSSYILSNLNSFSFNRLLDCPEKGYSNPGLGSIMSIVACERVYPPVERSSPYYRSNEIKEPNL